MIGPYFDLVRRNRTYRRYWIGMGLSMAGEWFTTIALFVLITDRSESYLALGLVATVRMLAFALPQPLVGLLNDRFSRKRIMIYTNLLCSLNAFAFLLVLDGGVVIILSLAGCQMALHSIYVSAERAALPNIVDAEDLITANALDSATWSTMLALGAAIGGLIVSVWGVETGFIIDGITFLIPALILTTIDIPQTVDPNVRQSGINAAVRNIIAGYRRIQQEPRLQRIVFSKAVWNLGGAGITGVFVVVAGADLGIGDLAAGVGLLYLARGIGTGIGPIIARGVFKDATRWPSIVAWMIVLSGAIYMFAPFALETAPLLFVIVLLAHAGSGVNWVLSTVLTQMWVEDEVRGRVTSADMLLMSALAATSAAAAGWLLDMGWIGIHAGFALFGGIMVLGGLGFAAWHPPDMSDNAQVPEGLVVGDG